MLAAIPRAYQHRFIGWVPRPDPAARGIEKRKCGRPVFTPSVLAGLAHFPPRVTGILRMNDDEIARAL